MAMNVLVTGGTGFIGSYLLKALSDEGHEITALDREPRTDSGLGDLPGVEIVKADLADFRKVEKHLAGKDACIQLALGCWSESAYDFVLKDTALSVWLLEAAAAAGVEQFIYTSSGEAPGAVGPVITEETRTVPVRAYGATKAATEKFVLSVSFEHEMRCNIIRPNFTFGNPLMPGCRSTSDSRTRDMCRQAQRGEDITLPATDGCQPIWAGDLARVYVAVLGSGENRRIYHAAGADYVRWREVAQEAARQAGSSSKVPPGPKDTGHGHFDVTPIREEFGLEFHPWPHLQEHIAYTLEHESG
jgi:UDP-glucose 4-epimerase